MRPIQDPDDDLARRFAGGDVAALREVYARWSSLVHAAVVSRLGTPGAPILTQRVFVSAWRSRDQVRPGDLLPLWLMDITWNEVANAASGSDWLGAVEAGPQDGVADRDVVLGFLAGLRDPQLSVARLAFQEGLTPHQISERVNMPLRAVVIVLRQILGPLGVILDGHRAGRGG